VNFFGQYPAQEVWKLEKRFIIVFRARSLRVEGELHYFERLLRRGRYFHCMTAVATAAASIGCPPRIFTSLTVPSGFTSACTCTVPVSLVLPQIVGDFRAHGDFGFFQQNSAQLHFAVRPASPEGVCVHGSRSVGKSGGISNRGWSSEVRAVKFHSLQRNAGS
jgi:hypothetical protein